MEKYVRILLKNKFQIVLFFIFYFLFAKASKELSIDPLTIENPSTIENFNISSDYTINIKLKLPKDFHAYEDQFKFIFLEPSGLKILASEITPLKKWFDNTSKKERTGIENDANLKITFSTPDHFLDLNNKVVLALTYQACTQSFCLFPKTKDITIPIQSPLTIAATKPISIFSTEGFNYYLEQSLLMALIIAFLAGILTSFTPCIFPMIPITLAILNRQANKHSRFINFLTSVVYVLGIASTYSVLGLLAARSGLLFGSFLANKIVLLGICILFFLMALSMYGAFELQLPHFISKHFAHGSKKDGLFGVYLSGLFAGIVASPCVGPVLVSILTYVASKGSLLFGFSLLFSYALGLGLIFIILGASTEFTKKLPKSGPWLEVTKLVLGTLMMMGVFYYLNLLLEKRIFDSLLGLFLVVFSSLYGAFLQNPHRKRDYVRKGLFQAILVVGITFIISGVFQPNIFISGPDQQTTAFNKNKKWNSFTKELLLNAKNEHKNVLIDFYADWCAACLQLEEKVFDSVEFEEKVQNFVLLKVNATKDSDELNEIKSQYGVVGLPTILFIDKNGQVRKDLTLTEFESKEKFIERLQRLL